MREHFSYLCKSVSDHDHRELKAEDVLGIFMDKYLNVHSPIGIDEIHLTRHGKEVRASVTFLRHGKPTTISASGNGSLDAVSQALHDYTGAKYILKVYTEHSVQEKASDSTAAAYIGIEAEDGTMYWGAGTNTDITRASIYALISAYNNMIQK